MIDYLEILKKALARHTKLREEEVIVVWFAKEIKNAKALFILDVPFGSNYYEVTLNGEKDEIYIDTYDLVQKATVQIPGEEMEN